MKESLCWQCAAGTSCQWINKGRPVKGWKAKKGSVSYRVEECPNFTKDGKVINADDDGMRDLAGAVLVTAGKDYNEVCESLEKGNLVKMIIYNENSIKNLFSKKQTIENFFRQNLYKEIIQVDPTYVMKQTMAMHGVKHTLEQDFIPYKNGVKDGYEFAQNERAENSPYQRALRKMEENNERYRQNKNMG